MPPMTNLQTSRSGLDMDATLRAMAGSLRLRCRPQTHLPGYVNDYEKLKSAGAEVVTCTAGA